MNPRRFLAALPLIALALTACGASEAAVAAPSAPSATSEHLSAAAAALMLAATCDEDVRAIVDEIVNTSDEARAEMDAFYDAGEAWQVAQYRAGIRRGSGC